MHHESVHVGQPPLEPVVIEREPLVIEAKKVQNRRVKVVDGRDVDRGLVPEIVGRPVRRPCVDTGAREPTREPRRIVIATARSLLKGRHPPELGAPDDDRVLEQSSRLQVTQQPGHRLIEDRAVDLVLVQDLLVAVPIADSLAAGLIGAVEELNESYALLEKTTGQDAVPREARLERILDVVGP